MNMQPSSPLENIKPQSPSGSVSWIGTPESASSSLTDSSLELQTTSPVPARSDETIQPPVISSLIDLLFSRTASSMPPSRSSPSPPETFPQHSRYYFNDDKAVFLVEGCLFRVHRYHLDKESQAFPMSTGSNYDPIELPGVTQKEFECLLDFFYDGMHNETTPSLADWTSLLSISTHFEMKRIRSRAIHEISTFRPRIDPVDQVMLAMKHDILEWLPLGYAALCQREEAIEIEEAKKLGLETTVLLAKAREVLRKITSNPFIPIGEDPGSPGSGYMPECGEDNHQDIPNLPFDEAVVSYVVDEIFWPAQPSPKPDKPSNKTPDMPSVKLTNSMSGSLLLGSSSCKPEAPFPEETSTGLKSKILLDSLMSEFPERSSPKWNAVALPEEPALLPWPWATPANIIHSPIINEAMSAPEEHGPNDITRGRKIRKGKKKLAHDSYRLSSDE